jgi:alcohol dehydrogenase class IV
MCNALLLNHVVDFNYAFAPERYDRIGQAMGVEMNGMSTEKRKDALLNAIVALRERTGIRTTIGALGVTRKDIPQLALNAFNDPCFATNPRKGSAQEIEKVYEAAL